MKLYIFTKSITVYARDQMSLANVIGKPISAVTHLNIMFCVFSKKLLLKVNPSTDEGLSYRSMTSIDLQTNGTERRMLQRSKQRSGLKSCKRIEKEGKSLDLQTDGLVVIIRGNVEFTDYCYKYNLPDSRLFHYSKFSCTPLRAARFCPPYQYWPTPLHPLLFSRKYCLWDI